MLPQSPSPARHLRHTSYFSAYMGDHVVNSNGGFHHFIRRPSQLHLLNGYWRFNSEEQGQDDLIAYACGFKCPEAVLLAEVRGEKPPDDIQIRWVPGSSDPFPCPRVGTAKHHLREIFEERGVLGKSTSPHDFIRVYPVSSDNRLRQHREGNRTGTLETNAQAYQSCPQETAASITSLSNCIQRTAGPTFLEASKKMPATPRPVTSRNPTNYPNPTSSVNARDRMPKPKPDNAESVAATPDFSATDPTTGYLSTPFLFTLENISEWSDVVQSQLPKIAPFPKRTEAARFPNNGQHTMPAPVERTTQQQSENAQEGSAAVPSMGKEPVQGSITNTTAPDTHQHQQSAAAPGKPYFGWDIPRRLPRSVRPSDYSRSPSPYVSPYPCVSSQDTSSNSIPSFPNSPSSSARIDGSRPPSPPLASALHSHNGSHTSGHVLQPPKSSGSFPSQQASTDSGTSRPGLPQQTSPAILTNASDFATIGHMNQNIRGDGKNNATNSLKRKAMNILSNIEPKNKRARGSEIEGHKIPNDGGSSTSPMNLKGQATASLSNAQPISKRSGIAEIESSRNTSDDNLRKNLKRQAADAPSNTRPVFKRARVDTIYAVSTPLNSHTAAKEPPKAQYSSHLTSPELLGGDNVYSFPTTDIDGSVSSTSSTHDAANQLSATPTKPSPHSLEEHVKSKDAGYLSTEPSVSRASQPGFSYQPDDALLYGPIPCMDCGELEDHKFDCNIGNIKPMENLNILQLRNISDTVARLDPGPWREHWNPPATPEPEDYATKLAGMAEIVRNEDSYQEDPDLHGLPDDAMLLLWAMKTSKGMGCEVIRHESPTESPTNDSVTKQDAPLSNLDLVEHDHDRP